MWSTTLITVLYFRSCRGGRSRAWLGDRGALESPIVPPAAVMSARFRSAMSTEDTDQDTP